MRRSLVYGLGLLVLCAGNTLHASQISGEYIESRTCDVYTGPCFANGQIGQAGREALMAWKVDKGSWNDVDLTGLGVVLVMNAQDTLGFNPSFAVNPYPVTSVILVDSNASSEQRDALVAFVKESTPKLSDKVVRVDSVPITLINDHLAGHGHLVAGKVAKIETRAMSKKDCVCTNEAVFYPPLTKISNSQPAYALKASFEGEGLTSTWDLNGGRSAFLGTFRK
ncbi:MAG: hypothetical protein JWM11_8108 [Planctomycetaceae bacterium]|nr:hypothetical protein [Planctomycetaceae bacterium]